MIRRVAAIALKESRHIMRDPRMLAVIFIMPVFMVILYGYSLKMDVDNIPIAVLDEDRTQASRELVRSFGASGYFDIIIHPQDRKTFDRLFQAGEIRAAIVIPEGFQTDRIAGPAAPVQVIVDGSDPMYAGAVANYSQAIAAAVSGPDTALPLDIREQYLFNPELEGSHFIIPGVVAVVLMMVCALLTSLTVAKEKETGTIDMLLVSPVRGYEIIIGKVIPYIILAIVDAVLVLAISKAIFDIPMRGSLVLLFWLTLLYVYAALGIGLFISAMAASQQVAMMAALVATIMPSIVLSGFIFSIFSMPAPIRAVSWIVPATHYIRIIRGILLKGSDAAELAADTGMLAIIGTVFVVLAMVRFTIGSRNRHS